MDEISALLGMGNMKEAEAQDLVAQLRSKSRVNQFLATNANGNTQALANADYNSNLEQAKAIGLERAKRMNEQVDQYNTNRTYALEESTAAAEAETRKRQEARDVAAATAAAAEEKRQQELHDERNDVIHSVKTDGLGQPYIVTKGGDALPFGSPKGEEATGGLEGNDVIPDGVSEMKELRQIQTDLQSFTLLKQTFKPQYAGNAHSRLNDLENFAQANLGVVAKGSEGQEAWHRNYKRLAVLQQRHDLFGGALTKTEQNEWVKSDINGGMLGQNVEKDLAYRVKLANKMARHDAAEWIMKKTDLRYLYNFTGAAFKDFKEFKQFAESVKNGTYYDELDAKKAADLKLWENGGTGGTREDSDAPAPKKATTAGAGTVLAPTAAGVKFEWVEEGAQ